MKALAKERLEARKRKLKQKKKEVSEEARLRSEDDLEQLEDMAHTQGGLLVSTLLQMNEVTYRICVFRVIQSGSIL